MRYKREGGWGVLHEDGTLQFEGVGGKFYYSPNIDGKVHIDDLIFALASSFNINIDRKRIPPVIIRNWDFIPKPASFFKPIRLENK